jgi:hypothetical protein
MAEMVEMAAMAETVAIAVVAVTVVMAEIVVVEGEKPTLSGPQRVGVRRS